MHFTVENGDLLKYNPRSSMSREYWIVHQCNCATVGKAAGLAKDLFEKYPEADIYKHSVSRIPGTIILKYPIINLLGQVGPGGASKKSSPPCPIQTNDKKDDNCNYYYDTRDARIGYFKSGLEEIKNNKLIHTNIMFPWGIGCGLARGDWKEYLLAIIEFARQYEYGNVKVIIKE